MSDITPETPLGKMLLGFPITYVDTDAEVLKGVSGMRAIARAMAPLPCSHVPCITRLPDGRAAFVYGDRVEVLSENDLRELREQIERALGHWRPGPSEIKEASHA